jgi:hypothetical protein
VEDPIAGFSNQPPQGDFHCQGALTKTASGGTGGWQPKEGRRRYMKTFYCVMSAFHDDGRVNSAILSMVCKEKPQSSCKHLPRMDTHSDWFDTYTDAVAFMAKAKEA